MKPGGDPFVALKYGLSAGAQGKQGRVRRDGSP